jgi:RNA polymerase sigma-70 factor (ECF subfamily)
MIETFDEKLSAARAGDEQAFRGLAEPHRREIQAHCYRMLGSLHDAEDLTQETMLRAWRRLDSFEGRSSLRAWLYKIATNACLDSIDKRPARHLPTDEGQAADPASPPAAPRLEPIWLEPYPDEWLPDTAPDPEAVVSTRQSVALAFLAALQVLPARQRAVLLMRDVLGWSADEVSQFLGMTVAAANSALQRARATLEARPAHGKEASVRLQTEALPTLLARYVRAWEEADLSLLASLLREDAVLAMPPVPSWYQGREAISAMLSASIFAGDARGRYRMVPTYANGAAAFGCYVLDPEANLYRPLALQVVELEGESVREMTSFLDPSLFAKFGLPATLPR